MKIKICGLTRIADAVWANELSPDYIGFVFAPSRRQLSGKQAKDIAEKLDPKIKRVGVFVNPTQQDLDDILNTCPLDIVQLHGEESPEFCEGLNVPVWKAFRIKDKEDFKYIAQYRADAYLFDGFHPDAHGGMGQVFDWTLMENFKTNIPIVIAGGINADNVVTVIDRVHPMAVDVSSSVETDGVKDGAKIKALIRKVREIDG